jgi:hypothetical protein
MKQGDRQLAALLCGVLFFIGGCGGGSSDSSSSGPATATTESPAGCYDLDWEFKPGSSSKITFRYVNESISGAKNTGTMVSEFAAVGYETSGLFPGHDAFKAITTVTWQGDQPINTTSYVRRVGPWTYDLAQTVDSVRYSGFGPVPSVTRTNFTPILTVTVPMLAVGQQAIQHRKGTIVTSRVFFPDKVDLLDTTEFIKLTGIETITVEAGRYEACRFERISSSTTGLSTTQWVIRGRGVTVKMITTEAGRVTRTEEATAVEIDGKRV